MKNTIQTRNAKVNEMTMAEMIELVLKNTSPAEMRHVRRGDTSVAKWIASHVLVLTDSQAESLAFRVIESVS